MQPTRSFITPPTFATRCEGAPDPPAPVWQDPDSYREVRWGVLNPNDDYWHHYFFKEIATACVPLSSLKLRNDDFLFWANSSYKHDQHRSCQVNTSNVWYGTRD